MTSMQLPQMGVHPQRLLFEDGIWRDSVRQPLYSSFAVDNAAIPSEMTFFSYARGALVPGAGNASAVVSTGWHTNMDVAGQLGKPKKFRCDGVAVLMPQIDFDAANAPSISDPGFSASATQDSELLEDLKLLIYSTFLELRIGEKFYANHPLWFFPCNIGYAGVAAVANDTVSAAAVGNLSVDLFHTVGVGFNFRTYPFLIEDQQAITARIRFGLSGTAPSFNDDRLITMYLTGNLYREVQ